MFINIINYILFATFVILLNKEANKTEKMLQDLISGNWWVAMDVINVKAVGYWPTEIFTTLSKHTTMV